MKVRVVSRIFGILLSSICDHLYGKCKVGKKSQNSFERGREKIIGVFI
jgi:hypothetical protein